MQAMLTAIMGLPKEEAAVTTEEVGGAFGMKSAPYPEYPALLVAARRPNARCTGWRRSDLS